MVYVNTDFAKQYGIDLTKDYTWDEIKELGALIHAQDEDAYLMTADADMLSLSFYSAVFDPEDRRSYD